jgi:hypothetical protein
MIRPEVTERWFIGLTLATEPQYKHIASATQHPESSGDAARGIGVSESTCPSPVREIDTFRVPPSAGTAKGFAATLAAKPFVFSAMAVQIISSVVRDWL